MTTHNTYILIDVLPTPASMLAAGIIPQENALLHAGAYLVGPMAPEHAQHFFTGKEGLTDMLSLFHGASNGGDVTPIAMVKVDQFFHDPGKGVMVPIEGVIILPLVSVFECMERQCSFLLDKLSEIGERTLRVPVKVQESRTKMVEGAKRVRELLTGWGYLGTPVAH